MGDMPGGLQANGKLFTLKALELVIFALQGTGK
jgi:hypothetical protein